MTRTIVIGVLLVVAVAGLYMVIQTRDDGAAQPPNPPVETAQQETPPPELAQQPLPPPEDFPDVPLTGLDGQVHSSRELAAGGSVVLFIDLHCPPCSEVVQKWQAAYDDHVVDRVFVVTAYPLEEIVAYRDARALTLPIYQDSQAVFKTEHNLVRFPFTLYVGASGIMRGGTYDPRTPLDGAEAARRMAM